MLGLPAETRLLGHGLSTLRGDAHGDNLAPDVGELYDHDVDPGEFENRWDDPAHAGVRRDLLALLAEVVNPHPRRLRNTGSLA